MSSLTLRAVFLSSFVVIACASNARADVADECANAAEKAQSLSHTRKLVEAKRELLTCARDACPLVVRKDCVDWLARYEARIPTIVLRVRDGRGSDVTTVRVSIDGAVVTERLDGSAIAVDPGEHTVRFEVRGASAIERPLLLNEGEHDHIVDAAFPVALTADGEIDKSATAIPPPHSEAPESGSHALSFVLGGIGLASLGAFAIVDAAAYGDFRNVRDGCGRTQTCASSEVSALHTGFDVAAIALGAGVVALTAASILYVRVDAKSGGATATIGARF